MNKRSLRAVSRLIDLEKEQQARRCLAAVAPYWARRESVRCAAADTGFGEAWCTEAYWRLEIVIKGDLRSAPDPLGSPPLTARFIA